MTRATELIHSFPSTETSEGFAGGLNKREYFAAIALQGLLTKYTLNKPEDQQIICKMAAELSNELINALNENS